MHAAMISAARGFTLIELMTVLAITALVMTTGVPSLRDFVAEQHVKTVASDIMAEIAFARAQGLEHSRRIVFERTGATWANGWRIFVDLNANNTYDAGEEIIKVFDGIPAGSIYLCSTVPDFASTVIFGPDGRVVRATAVGANDGIYVVDLMGDADLANNKIRGILFGASGRSTLVRMNGAAAPC